MKLQKKGIATLGLIFITFLAAIQYAFLRNVPNTVSSFAFVCITNGIGLVALGLTRFRKLRGIGKSTLKKGVLFALELTGFNFFLLLGSRHLDPVIISSVVSLYFVFITPLMLLLRKKVSFFSGIATVIAIIALLLMFGTDTRALFSSADVVYLIIADVFFAAYVVSVSVLGEKEDPTQLTFAQMLFSAMLALIGWVIENIVSNRSFSLPTEIEFWISALFFGIFIRALYGLIQIACQKHVSALKASLIFSSEIIITLLTNPIMCSLFHMEYTGVTVFQIFGGVLLIIATLMVDDTVMAKLGYGDLQAITYVDASGKTVNRVSVSRKIILTTLTCTLLTLLLSVGTFLSAIYFIRDSAVENSQNLGSNAAAVSTEAMMEKLNESMKSQVDDKALLAQEKLTAYSDAVYFSASYASSLYANKADYPDKEVERPLKENAGIWVMQRTLANSSLSYDDLRAESALLGNMVDVFAPIVEKNKDIATVYLGTEDGLLISYDPYSDTGDTVGEGYYEYRDSVWYEKAKNADAPIFTDTYQDSYGRGLTITCVAPFTDQNGTFAGCIAMDILMRELNASMVNDGIVDPRTAVLIDNRGNYIAGNAIEETSEDLGSIFDEGKNRFLRLAGNEILAKKNGVLCVEDRKSPVYIAFATIESTDWTICILNPVSAVIGPATAIRNNIDENTNNVVQAVVQGILQVILTGLLLSALILLVVTLVAGRISRRISDPLKTLEADVRQISGGRLANRTCVSTNDEIGSLANSFNYMTDSLQKYIADLKDATAKEERIAGELSVAADIQASMLPKNFEDYSGHKEFDLYATMDPAKEVGGDFYDFFMIDEDHIALIIADVSGKGVPAALFMVTAKTLIKDQAQNGSYSPAEIIASVNEKLCADNESGYFVTVWMAIVELSTGKGRSVNAGHEHPALRRKNGKFELVEYRHSPPVGLLDFVAYRDRAFDLKAGDSIFVYTDGIPEAADSENEPFGYDRMLAALNASPGADLKALLTGMKASVDGFVGEAPQFDDLTMLGFTYFGAGEPSGNDAPAGTGAEAENEENENKAVLPKKEQKNDSALFPTPEY